MPTMERVAVPAHTRPKYQLASWCKRWAGLALAGPVQSGPRSRWGTSHRMAGHSQILLCTPLCTAELPHTPDTTFCWLLAACCVLRAAANQPRPCGLELYLPSLRPHRAFLGPW